MGLDRKAIRDYVARTEHKTIIGPVRFEGSENISTPGTVAQWQKGEFEVVWPRNDRHRAAGRAEAGLGLNPGGRLRTSETGASGRRSVLRPVPCPSAHGSN